MITKKMSKQPHKRTAKHKRRQQQVEPTLPSQKPSYDDPAKKEDIIPDGVSGQHFYMDFGFVRGSDYSMKKESGPTITRIDGFNSYLVIVDQVTRYLWIFLTTSKNPPITIA